MIVNFLLLVFAFGAAKKKMSPYAAAAIFGAVKAVFYFIGSKSVAVSLIAFILFAALVAGLIFFFRKLDEKEVVEDPKDLYSSNPKAKFKWEYIPITVLILAIMFGETAITLAMS